MNQHGVAGTGETDQSNPAGTAPQVQGTQEVQPIANDTGPVNQSNMNVTANNVAIVNPQQPNPSPAIIAAVPQLAGTPLITSLHGNSRFMSEGN
ncbi:unnamed protein product [Rhizoctonia solani]|uniref:Uncharacterized protein n=1 Tax=Rhizoctonia solani TaxID=456999 RepID=A0A8H3GB79_9AGAM|nr:unnamed protein product [Rhizoctonia solani]